MIDAGAEKILKGVYGFLSEKGSHPPDKNGDSSKDSQFGLSQTYEAVAFVLDRFKIFQDNKKK